jgi:hypothetical protein
MDEIPLPDESPSDDASDPQMLVVELANNVEISDFISSVEIESTVLPENNEIVADMDIQANTPTFGPVYLPPNDDADADKEQDALKLDQIEISSKGIVLLRIPICELFRNNFLIFSDYRSTRT